MSSEVQRVRERYRAAAFSALLRTSLTLPPLLGAPFNVAVAGAKASQSFRDQWCERSRHPDRAFDWLEIWRRHRDLDTLHLAIWSEEEGRLSGLATCLSKGAAIEIRYLEGDYRGGCPLRGLRAVIAVEAAANYAQAIGKRELRISPVNEAVRDLYQIGLGFEPVMPAREEPYFRRCI